MRNLRYIYSLLLVLSFSFSVHAIAFNDQLRSLPNHQYYLDDNPEVIDLESYTKYNLVIANENSMQNQTRVSTLSLLVGKESSDKKYYYSKIIINSADSENSWIIVKINFGNIAIKIVVNSLLYHIMIS